MASASIFLEDSHGGHQNDPTPAQIAATVERVGDSLDHCVLHLPGDAFVQTAGSPGALLIQYADATGMYESGDASFDATTVARVFTEAMRGTDGWKREFSFERTGDAEVSDDERTGATPRTASGTGTMETRGSDGAAHTNESMKDQIVRSVKQDIARQASRGVSNLIRRGIRSITGR